MKNYDVKMVYDTHGNRCDNCYITITAGNESEAWKKAEAAARSYDMGGTWNHKVVSVSLKEA